MWNKLIVSLENRKFVYFAGLLLFSTLFLGAGRAIALNDGSTYNGYHWYPNHGPVSGTGYNLISDNAYMQLAVSRDGYTDITRTNLKVYSTGTYISLEIFGADICTNQPSYTTDELFTSNRSNMRTRFSLTPADDERSRIGVISTSATRVSDSATGSYQGSCTAANAKETLYARSNIYDETLGMYVFNFSAEVTSGNGFVNGFRVRALRSATTSSGIFVSADPGNSPDQFGIEVGYPRSDEGNPSASSTYADYAVPFVPDCGSTAVTTKRITLFDDDNSSASIQGNRRFRVKVVRTDGADRDIRFSSWSFSPGGGSISGPAADGYYTVTGARGGEQSYSYLNFPMDPDGTYLFRVDNLYQNNTLQISIPTTTSPNRRNCPTPAQLNGVKIDNSGVGLYGGAHLGMPFTSTQVRVESQNSPSLGTRTSTANPFLFRNAQSIPVARPVSGNRYTVRLASVPAGWSLVGATICDASLSSCTIDYLKNPANVGSRTGTSFSWQFYSGKAYNMRWIFRPATTVACDYSNVRFPDTIDPWTTFSIRAGVTYDSNTYVPPNPRVTMRIIKNADNTDVFGPTLGAPTLVPGGGAAAYTYQNINRPANPATFTPGTYTARWVYQDNSLAVGLTCNSDFIIGYQPYVTVLGGDAVAGDGADVAGVKSWNVNNIFNQLPANYGGAGSDLATLATGDVNSFATGRWLAGGATNPVGLAFANDAGSTDVSTARYGGSLTSVPSRSDYYSIAEGSATTITGVTNVNVSGLASGVYKYENDITITGSVAPGRNITILSTGDITIGSNVGYQAYTLSTVPRLNVFTESGDIMVDNDVTEMHGFFATGPGGSFYSCALQGAPTTRIEYADLGARFGDCDSRLRVYGVVQADTFILGRTSSSLSQPAGQAAEEFIYSAEIWLPRDPSPSTTVQSYVTLPPVL